MDAPEIRLPADATGDASSSEPDLGDLAVIVVNYGPADLLKRELAAAAKDLAPARVVVVDNYSTDTARTEVRELCRQHGWTGLFPDANTGFGAGSNLGAEAALADGARYLLFLNPDASIDRTSVERLLRRAVDDPDLLVAPRTVRTDGTLLSMGVELDLATGNMRGRHRPEGRRPAGETLLWVAGACLLVEERLWRRMGGFDHTYFLYWEDVDLCARAVAAGGRVEVVEEATAVHDPGQTHTAPGVRAKSDLYYYYNIRNRHLFAAKWLDESLQREWRRNALPAAYRILLRGGRRQFLHPVGPIGAAWRGLRDGTRMGA